MEYMVGSNDLLSTILIIYTCVQYKEKLSFCMYHVNFP